MPELPEVEYLRRELEIVLPGEVIKKVSYDVGKMLRPQPKLFIDGVIGKSISQIRRRAKLLIFVLAPQGFFTVHLRLSGRLFWRPSTAPADKFVHVVLHFASGYELRFAEARKFGYFEYIKNEIDLEKRLKDYGPEIDLVSWKNFSQILESRQRIKSLLMDQSKIAGIGNIYANDALWLARIAPQRSAESLSPKERQRLWKALQQVIEESLKKGGASDQWYRHLDGSKGNYQNFFKIYGQRDESCPRCGEKIKYESLGGRGTFWCPGCQN